MQGRISLDRPCQFRSVRLLHLHTYNCQPEGRFGHSCFVQLRERLLAINCGLTFKSGVLQLLAKHLSLS